MSLAAYKQVMPIYAFAIAWVIFFATVSNFVISGIFDIVLLFIMSAIVSGIVRFVIFINETKSPVRSTGNPEVDAIVSESWELINEMRDTRDKLRNKKIASKTNEIIDISNDIIHKLRRQPELLSSIKRFLNYYLPTTKKLITNYSYMESQSIKGENISNTMQKIEDSLDTLKNAYKKQLDTLFSHTAMDLSTEIDVLENILKKEGLTQNNFGEKAVEADADTNLNKIALDTNADIEKLEGSLNQDTKRDIGGIR